MPSICIARKDGLVIGQDEHDDDIQNIWVEDVEVYEDEDEIRQDYPVLGDHELKIADTEGFLSFKLGDMSIDEACELAKIVEAHGEAAVGYAQNFGDHYLPNICDDSYVAYPADKGKHATMSGKEVFAWTMFEDQFGEVPNWLIHAIDWDRAAEEYLAGQSAHEDSDGTFYVYEEE